MKIIRLAIGIISISWVFVLVLLLINTKGEPTIDYPTGNPLDQTPPFLTKRPNIDPGFTPIWHR